MKRIISILIITLCSAFCWAQGNDFLYNKEMLRMSREMFDKKEYDSALYFINKAVLDKGKILVNPELSADIHEQYCLVLSALDMRQESDYHRNMYLDIKEIASQSHNSQKEQEIQNEAQWLSTKIVLLTIAIIALIITFIFFKDKFSVDERTGDKILSKKEYNTQDEELQEQLALLQHKIRTNKEQNIDKRTKLFLINTVSPLIARLRHAIDTQDNDYALEILNEIEQYNNLLTDWIRLEQGKLSFKIETFNIGELLDILRRNAKTFAIQGITLSVGESAAKVKADKILTLFMLNTLADNARKATNAGGEIAIYSEEKDDYLELSVKDSGKGMSEEVAASVFTHAITNGHGFGLLNCRGIINSYKKVGSLFNSCMIGVESKEGKGSRFFFRLPIVKCIVYALLTMSLFFSSAQSANAVPTTAQQALSDSLLRKAYEYADSAYYLNIEGNFQRALNFVDSTQVYLMHTMPDSPHVTEIMVYVTNEAALAALGLHRWEDYRTYNNMYENAFRKLKEDASNEDEIKKHTKFLEDTRTAWTIVNIAFVIAIIFVIIFLIYMRSRRKRMLLYREELEIDDKKSLCKQLEYENESLHISNNILANGLSTIKHETMYYPSRIATLLRESAQKDGEKEPNFDAAELTLFYEQLYNNLAQQLADQKISNGIKLLRKPLGNKLSIRTDNDLYAFLLLQIKKYLKVQKLDITYRQEGAHTEVIINAENLTDTDCFSPTARNIPMLISRQIMRETSAIGSHGNGIIVENDKIILRFS